MLISLAGFGMTVLGARLAEETLRGMADRQYANFYLALLVMMNLTSGLRTGQCLP